MPVVFELDPGQAQEMKVTGPSGTVERSIQLLAVREFYWPNSHMNIETNWNTNSGARFAAGWFYHWPVRGARPGTPLLFWNRLSGTTGPAEIDFGDDTKPVRIDQEISHASLKAGLYTAASRSRGPADEPVEVRMRVVIEPSVADAAETSAVRADDFLNSVGVCSAVSRRGENLVRR